MKSRTVAIAGAFGRYSLSIFAVALMVVGLLLTAEGVCCCFQSESDE